MHGRTRGATCQAWDEHRAGRGAQKFADYCVVATCKELRERVYPSPPSSEGVSPKSAPRGAEDWTCL